MLRSTHARAGTRAGAHTCRSTHACAGTCAGAHTHVQARTQEHTCAGAHTTRRHVRSHTTSGEGLPQTTGDHGLEMLPHTGNHPREHRPARGHRGLARPVSPTSWLLSPPLRPAVCTSLPAAIPVQVRLGGRAARGSPGHPPGRGRAQVPEGQRAAGERAAGRGHAGGHEQAALRSPRHAAPVAAAAPRPAQALPTAAAPAARGRRAPRGDPGLCQEDVDLAAAGGGRQRTAGRGRAEAHPQTGLPHVERGDAAGLPRGPRLPGGRRGHKAGLRARWEGPRRSRRAVSPLPSPWLEVRPGSHREPRGGQQAHSGIPSPHLQSLLGCRRWHVPGVSAAGKPSVLLYYNSLGRAEPACFGDLGVVTWGHWCGSLCLSLSGSAK